MANRFECGLLLDDEPIIQMSVTQLLMSLGVARVEAFGTVEDALEFLGDETPDFALLDHRLARNETSDPVARLLMDRDVPLAMTTGLGELWDAPAALDHLPKLGKPLDAATLERFLKAVAS